MIGRPQGIRGRPRHESTADLSPPFVINYRPIAEGGDATVFKCEIGPEYKGRGDFIVVKQFRELAKRNKEAERLSRLRGHRRILQDITPPAGAASLDSLYLPFIDGGNLSDWVLKEGHLQEGLVARLALQLTGAIAHCHKHHIAHGDIKPGNVLVSDALKPPRKESPIVRDVFLIDFGSSIYMPEPGKIPLVNVGQLGGTSEWAAPEVAPYLECRQQNKGEKSPTYDPFRADMWSLGAVVFFMLTGNRPVPKAVNCDDMKDEKYGLLLEEGTRAFIYESLGRLAVSLEAKEFISSLLKVDASKRKTAEELLESAWLKSLPHLRGPYWKQMQSPRVSALLQVRGDRNDPDVKDTRFVALKLKTEGRYSDVELSETQRQEALQMEISTNSEQTNGSSRLAHFAEYLFSDYTELRRWRSMGLCCQDFQGNEATLLVEGKALLAFPGHSPVVVGDTLNISIKNVLKKELKAEIGILSSNAHDNFTVAVKSADQPLASIVFSLFTAIEHRARPSPTQKSITLWKHFLKKDDSGSDATPSRPRPIVIALSPSSPAGNEGPSSAGGRSSTSTGRRAFKPINTPRSPSTPQQMLDQYVDADADAEQDALSEGIIELEDMAGLNLSAPPVITAPPPAAAIVPKTWAAIASNAAHAPAAVIASQPSRSRAVTTGISSLPAAVTGRNRRPTRPRQE